MSWVVDKAHTSLGFSVKHMMISAVRGTFADFSGDVDLDVNDFTKSKITGEVEVASIYTRQPERDKHLLSPDFFDVEKFPKISYQSTSIERKSDDEYVVTGDLTIKDTTRPLSLNVIFSGVRVNPYGVRVAGFEVTGKLSRKDFGLLWNVSLETGGVVVGDEVKLNLDVEVKEE